MSDIQKVGILGSGIMGSGLAEVAARAGYEVVVRSRSLTAANAMIASIDKGFAKAIEPPCWLASPPPTTSVRWPTAIS